MWIYNILQKDDEPYWTLKLLQIGIWVCSIKKENNFVKTSTDWRTSCKLFLYWQTDITNSISSLGKLSKNEIQQPNNYKKIITKRYLSELKKPKNYKQLHLKTSKDRRTSCKLLLHWQNRFRYAEGIPNECICLKSYLVRI